MRIIYSSTLSSRLGSGLRAQMWCALIAVFSFYLFLSLCLTPVSLIFAGSTGLISFFHSLSLSLSHFLSFPSTTETWRWAYHFLHHRTKLSCWLWISVCVCVWRKRCEEQLVSVGRLENNAFLFCFKLASVWRHLLTWYLWWDASTDFDHLQLCCCDTLATCPGFILHLVPNACWDMLQPCVTLSRTSSLGNGWKDDWMYPDQWEADVSFNNYKNSTTV